MAFYGYKGDFDRCYSTPYSTSYDYGYGPTPVQASSHYSSPYEFGEPELIEYKSSAYYKDDSFVTPFDLNYSVNTYSEPKMLQYDPIEHHSSYNYYESSVNPSEINYSQPRFLQYDPPSYDRGYFPSKFTISYSTVEFNEPEFEEYDPTPYDGGYDPVTTYGKPVPPSDITCYPRTLPESDSLSLENFSYSSIPSPYGKDDDLPIEPPNESKPIATKTETETETHVENGGKVTSNGKEVEIVEPDMIPGDDSPSYEHQDGLENGKRGDYGYESERQWSQIPYGSGLEALDLCESIFGYWPCLAKTALQQRNKCQICDQEGRMDPWGSAAVDYLFGSPIVYDYENYHHHRQPQYQYDQNSWLQ